MADDTVSDRDLVRAMAFGWLCGMLGSRKLEEEALKMREAGAQHDLSIYEQAADELDLQARSQARVRF